MEIGLIYPTWLNVDGFRIGLLREITVGKSEKIVKLYTDSHLGKKLKRRLEDLEKRAGASGRNVNISNQ
jgi:hypothetical protein